MHRATIKLLLALSLAVTSIAGGVSIAAASQHENLSEYQVLSKLYFPFVPNGEMIGDTGPWHGTISIQNMETDPVKVWIMEDGRFNPDEALMEMELYSYESESVSVSELELEGTGSSVVVMAMEMEIWNTRDNATGLQSLEILGELDTPNVTASLKQASGAPMFEGVWSDHAQTTLDGYTAIPINDVGWGTLTSDCPAERLIDCADTEGLQRVDGTSYLPLAQTNTGWNTQLYVTNVEGAIDQASTVQVDLVPGDGSDNETTWSQEVSIGPGETWKIDVLEAVGTDWTGSVRITSDAGMAALAARHKASTDMLLTNTSGPSRNDDGDGYRLTAPLIYNDWGGWNTGFSLSNQSGTANQVVVEFYDEEGDPAGEATRTIPSQGHTFIYLPSEVDPSETDEGWYGSAVLRSTNNAPFHAAVDQVNYHNGAAMSYTLGSVNADDRLGNQKLGLPLFQKANLDGEGDTSGIQLFNPHPEHGVQLEVELFDDGSDIEIGGEEVLELDLGPLSSYTLFAPDEGDIPMNTEGAAVVTVTGGGGQVAAVSNLVNYDVQGDGALVFNLSNGSGQFR